MTLNDAVKFDIGDATWAAFLLLRENRNFTEFLDAVLKACHDRHFISGPKWEPELSSDEVERAREIVHNALESMDIGHHINLCNLLTEHVIAERRGKFKHKPEAWWDEAHQPITPEAPAPLAPETTMLKVGGKRFRCDDCGSNCFTKAPPDLYTCNGCGTRYRGVA